MTANNIADEAQKNLDELDRQYKWLMREKIWIKIQIVAGLIVFFLGLGNILWLVWGLG